MKGMLDLAARVALGGSDDRNFRLGCVAKRKDGAVVFSTNSKTRTPQPSAHAEAKALKKAGRGSTLWIARVNKDKSWTVARPCIHCQTLIRNKGVVKVYYTISPGEHGVWYPQKEIITKPLRKIKKNNSTIWFEL